MEHAPFLAALFGALAGALEGFVLAIVVAHDQHRRGVKSGVSLLPHLLFGAFSGGLTAGVAGIWLSLGAAVGAGAAAWPLLFGFLWILTQTSLRGRP